MATTYEPIATTTLAAQSFTITFSSIPSTYTDLRLVLNHLGAVGSTGYNPVITFNNDTATNYSYTNIQGNGTAASSSRGASTTEIALNGGATSTSIPTLSIVDIFSYAGSTNKTVLTRVNGDANGSGYVTNAVALWRNTSAISTITLTMGVRMGIGTTATLYGILKA